MTYKNVIIYIPDSYRRKTGYFHAEAGAEFSRQITRQAGDARRVISGCVPFQAFSLHFGILLSTLGCVLTSARAAGAPRVFFPPSSESKHQLFHYRLRWIFRVVAASSRSL